jgi:hypothetical protein
VGAFQCDGSLVSLGKADELCLLTEYAEGKPYAQDLERLLVTGEPAANDWERADSLCDYLLEIHRQRGGDPGLYTRRIRELVGHGECIMGLIDSYPDHPAIPRDTLKEIERTCVEWRWRLKDRVHRLRQVHGDFHPWNILFTGPRQFRLLDRSRGEWGDPADDATCLAMNYYFFSLQRSGKLEGCFGQLWSRFWDRYLQRSGDPELLEVTAPFLAFRGLVMASPLWYPSLSDSVRQKILAFVLASLAAGKFDPAMAYG